MPEDVRSKVDAAVEATARDTSNLEALVKANPSDARKEIEILTDKQQHSSDPLDKKFYGEELSVLRGAMAKAGVSAPGEAVPNGTKMPATQGINNTVPATQGINNTGQKLQKQP
jgi:hypothetical protein